MTTWKLDAEKILQSGEITRILTDLRCRSRRSVNSRMNLIVFRLATCCGLRASEIGGITLGDVLVDNDLPSIRIRCQVAKGGKSRRVPLHWDAGTLADLTTWKAFRRGQGASDSDLFICSQHVDSLGHRIDRRNMRLRFKACCRVLGAERQASLTVHSGRHSFVSHALQGGRSLAEVRDAAGHASIATTSIYTHAVADDGRVSNLFDF